jgi:hypothetical protein
MKVVLFTLLLFISALPAAAQIDSGFIAKLKSLDSFDGLKGDTVAVPEDQLTKKIRQLRAERSGLTTETLIRIKISDEQEKDKTHGKEYYQRLIEEMTTGKTGRLLENCMLNLYRRNFTEPEIDELIRFYKTSAGKKMDTNYFLLMVQSVKDAEQLLKLAMK